MKFTSLAVRLFPPLSAAAQSIQGQRKLIAAEDRRRSPAGHEGDFR